MGNRMDGMRSVPVFTNVSHFPGYQVYTERLDEPDKLSFWQQRALDLRLTTMAPPTKPYWNTTMVTAWVAVIVGFFTIMGSIGALYLYTDAVAEQRGIEKGRHAAEKEQQQKEMEKMERELRVLEEKLKQGGQ